MSVADRIAALTPEQRALLEKLREKQRLAAARPPQPPAVPRRSGATGEGDWPLSLDQERFWFMEQLSPSGAGLNISAATRMRGPVSVPVVAAALDEIVRRHAAWRTAFPIVDGGPVQRVAASRRQLLAVVDLTSLPAERREPEALRLVGEDVAASFPLEAGPLVRASLLRMGRTDHLCLLTVHHLVTDWISFQIAWGELAALYDAFAARRPPALPEPPVQYSDFAIWQRDWLQGEVLADLVSWWRERLEGFPLALDLPTDRPRPALMRMRGGRRMLRVPRALSEALRALARAEGATLFMTVLAAAAALLHRGSGQEKLILGANNANRNRPEIEPVLGCFLTQVPFPIDLTGNPTFHELLARVRQAALGAYAHQDLPFGKLVEAVQPQRDTSRQPLIQSLVQVLDGQYSQVELAGVTFEAVDAYDGNARYDLMLTLFDYPDGLVGSLEYDADLFDPATAERWVELLLLQAEAFTADPGLRLSALPVLTAAARHQVLAEWSDTAVPLPGWTVPERFAEQAARTPEAIAIIAGGEELTYADLDGRSDELARRLRALGIARESRAALLLGRTPDVPVAILAVWKAGGAFVPLDPTAPAERLAGLLEDADPAVVIHRGSLPMELPAGIRSLDLTVLSPLAPGGGQEEETPLATPEPSDLAYLIYTSGTTGRPKAVMIEHGSLAMVLGTVLDRFAFQADDRVTYLARFSLDISLVELFAPLLAGGVCEMLPEDDVLDPDRLLAALERATRAHAVPSLMRRIVEEARQRGPQSFRRLRTLITGGDLVPPDLLADLLATFPAAEIAVLYGPTETSIVCTGYPVPRDRRPERPLIGRPLDNVELRVVDPRGGLVPLGVPGELWVGGPGVARGYFRRDELTAERFVQADGRRFYRTGDLVRQLAGEGGALEFLGRTDFQVKIRGFRIEPGEIEAALAEHPGVREAVVVARADAGGEKRLVAYVVAAPSAQPSELRAHLAARLPAYMVPSAVVLLPELPLTVHGKVDRARLPAPEGPSEEAGGEAPRTPAEEVVAGIWCEVLGLPRVSRSANFFDLGGHSLLATRVVSRLRAAIGAELPLRELFQSPTVAALAASLEVFLSAGASAAAAPPIEPVPRGGDLPLSFAQERLWFLDRLSPGNAAYNIPLVLAVRGELSLPAMESALGEMVRRHEALRTTLEARGDRPVQVIAPPGRWTLPLVDLSDLREERRLEEVRRLADEAVAGPFDLERDPVLRARAVRLGPDEHALLLVVHHIAADGWSVGVMVEEIAALYRAALAGAPSPLPELAVQYADFAVWQREWLRGEVLERQLGYWRNRLAGLPVLVLPADRPRPPVQSFRGATRIHAIGPETTRALAALARRNDATLFMVLLAAVQTLLGRYTGQEDLAVGSPIANRTRAEIEPLIGFFVNSLVLRADLSDDPPFAELVARSRRAALEAYSHQDLPFERLVEELRPERRLAHNPLFQVMFALQNAPLQAVDLPGLTFSTVEFEFPATRFDLEVLFTEIEGGLSTQLTWSTQLFDPATVLRLAGRLDALFAAVIEDPCRRLSEIPLLAGPERHQVLLDWNDTAAEPPREDVAALFAARAAAAPWAVAVAVGAASLTYCELAIRAAALARELRTLGAGPDVPVGLHAGRSLELVVGALAVLWAGGAYVPLDPSYPDERLAFIVRESGMPVLLTRTVESAAAPSWTGGARVIRLDAGAPLPTESLPEPLAVPPEALAYVIYTSGSTGRPKGVKVSRAGLLALVRWHLRAWEVSPRDRATLIASPAFDASVWEVWPYLAAGASLHVPDEETRLTPDRLLAWLAAEGITLSFLPTPLAEQVLEQAERELPPGLALRALLTGGDRLQRPPRRPLPFQLGNHYGPTESSVVTTWTTVAPVPEGEAPRPPAIGRPVDGTRTYVLDPRLGQAALGIPGELAVAGAGLARGYLGRPDLTAERFVPDPFAGHPGERMYRTGDLARHLPGGEIEFLGRLDTQVKVRGFRIELGEIESVLARHPQVREAVAVARDDGGAGRRLVAYVVQRPADRAAPGDGEAVQHISQWQDLYDETYGKGPATDETGDPTFNIQGWNSSYTGEPIPAAEMREWVETAVGRLLALPHRRVLEVGCGTGLLLFRVAPYAERYRGSDFSAVALGHVRRQVEKPGSGLAHVELDRRLADDWSGIAPGDFDLVVLNSVVQYFPGIDYLVRVLEGALAAASPGGAVFVGDVRSLPLLAAFYATVELHQAPASRTVAELRARVRRRLEDEEELVIDPAFFAALARRLPGVRAEVLLKRGRADNELTRFRYDAVLHLDGGAVPAVPEALDWRQTGLSLPALERRLAAAAPPALALAGIPSARLAAETALVALLADPAWQERTAGELRQEVAERAARAGAVEPEDLWQLADRLGYEATVTWSARGGADGCYDAVLGRQGAELPVSVQSPAAGVPDRPWREYANAPLEGNLVRRLVPELRRFLEAELPDYMVPSAIVLLDSLPLTPAGKIDRVALPAPERRGEPAESWLAPATPLEELLARVAAELLGIERVGMRDNFFDLGGHSLLATQLVSRLAQEHGVRVTLQMVFDSATLADLADQIVQQELASADGELLDDVLREVDGLSEEELQALLGQAGLEEVR
jgi:amino acid adenylation domain-containing protein